MRMILVYCFCLLLVIFATGCQSLEHSRAVKQGDTPWYVVTITSPEMVNLEEEMNIYKLLRKVDLAEEQMDKLKTDKTWGEGHKSIKTSDSGTIKIHAQISKDKSEMKMCGFQMQAFSVDEKGPFIFSLDSTKLDRCEKTKFYNPYFSARIQTEDREWKTLNFEFRRLDGGQ